MPWQSLPPIILITGGLGLAGGLQYGVSWIYKTDKPSDGPAMFRKLQGLDEWDYRMQNRDGKLWRQANPGKKIAWWDYKGGEAKDPNAL
mmetsp:Transcript_123656/g.184935  ORF Transcript_123656/g.184935 Transcript_123656/m.184935 type:complete len:89 (-) Transcript_123656:68-334(-)